MPELLSDYFLLPCLLWVSPGRWMVLKLCCVCARDEALECSANRQDLSCNQSGCKSMEESLQFLLNYADIWVWQGLILLYGQSAFCCCRLVRFQLTFFCPIVTRFWTCCWQMFFLISPFNLVMYCVFVYFYSFPFFSLLWPFFFGHLVWKCFSPSLLHPVISVLYIF